MDREPPFNPRVRSLALQAQAGTQAFVPEDDEVPGPPDRELLCKYIRGELPPGSHAAREVEDTVSAFRSWYDAFCELLQDGGEG